MASTGTQQGGGKSSGHTPGAVKDPEHDGRLKENRAAGVSMKGESQSRGGGSQEPGGSPGRGHRPGAVKDPEHDRRLKENRDKRIHKGIHKGGED